MSWKDDPVTPGFKGGKFSDVCRLSVVCLSVCLSSVTLVRPTQRVGIFGNISMPFGILAIHWHSRNILQRSSQEKPSVWGVKRKRANQTSFWTYRRLCFGNGAIKIGGKLVFIKMSFWLSTKIGDLEWPGDKEQVPFLTLWPTQWQTW